MAQICPEGGEVTDIGTCYDGCCDKYRCTVCGEYTIEAAG